MNFRYEVDIEIDELTDCLIERKSSKRFKTEYALSELITKEKAQLLQTHGWKFDWSIPQKEGYNVYELKIKGNNEVQGMIALKNNKDNYCIEGALAESAPENLGHSGIFKGVGGNLFAIACKLSFEAGYEGFFQFTAKTNLIDYYAENLYAKRIGNTDRMYVDTNGALNLIQKYFRED